MKRGRGGREGMRREGRGKGRVSGEEIRKVRGHMSG